MHKKFYRRALAASIATISAAALLTGCGGSDSGDVNTGTTTPTPTATVF